MIELMRCIVLASHIWRKTWYYLARELSPNAHLITRTWNHLPPAERPRKIRPVNKTLCFYLPIMLRSPHLQLPMLFEHVLRHMKLDPASSNPRTRKHTPHPQTITVGDTRTQNQVITLNANPSLPYPCTVSITKSKMRLFLSLQTTSTVHVITPDEPASQSLIRLYQYG
jgi:hypothetical protein